MKVFGLFLNVFSLGGLVLGVGIVVDNFIVMLEIIVEGVGMIFGKVNFFLLIKGEMCNQAIVSS